VAKITIEIEDFGDDKVKIKSSPTVEQMFKWEVDGQGMTNAMGYAVGMLNKCRDISKSNDPTNRIIIPKLGKY